MTTEATAKSIAATDHVRNRTTRPECGTVQSCRRAMTGLTAAARRAGMNTASNATVIIAAIASDRVGGSIAVTPNNVLAMSRVAPQAAARPTIRPAATRV